MRTPGSPSPGAGYTTWDTAAHTIQEAVDASVNGDLIWVTNGVYNVGGRALAGGITNRVAIDRAITVKSIEGPSRTAIVGGGAPLYGSLRAIRCAYIGAHATLDGFTLTNGATASTLDTYHTRAKAEATPWRKPTECSPTVLLPKGRLIITEEECMVAC